jgi:hypothetical protein
LPKRHIHIQRGAVVFHCRTRRPNSGTHPLV